MELTPRGHRAEMLDVREKEKLAQDLIEGLKDVSDYIKGVCYDSVAYVGYLRNSFYGIGYTDVLSTNGQSWISKYPFKTQWTGGPIAAGIAVGFCANNGSFFHAALAVGGTNIRGINGFRLGPGWLVKVDLISVLGLRNGDGTYNYDGRKIRVFLWSD